MKTHSFKLNTWVSIGLALFALVACNKKEDSNGNLANTPQMYSLINGQCYNTQTNQIMPNTSYCLNNGLNNGYYMNNGQCYNNMGQIMPNTSYCMNSGTGYYMSGGYCYSSTGQMMPNTSYCSNAYQYNNGYNNGYTNGMLTQQCYGSYLYQSGYFSQMFWCTGSNCRGYTLYEINTNRSVVCQ